MMVSTGLTHDEAWAMRIDESVAVLLARAKLMKRMEPKNAGAGDGGGVRVLPDGTREVRFSGTLAEVHRLLTGKGSKRV